MAVASVTTTWLFLLLLLVSLMFHATLSVTFPGDATAMRSLMAGWKPSWQTSDDDPCGQPWEGITCNDDSRIITLKLSNMGLKGGLGGDIGSLTELKTLDLSFNKDLAGPLSPQLGNLINLNFLVLGGCSFSGSIPQELGNLSKLYFLGMNSNKFTGGIPPSLGNLSTLYWLDLSDNQLTGPLPVSNASSPVGLDKLLQAGHFHLQKNQLSGSIPPQLFSPRMKLFHLILYGNQLTGSIPSTIELAQSLEVVRLDRNNLTGEVPSNLSSLKSVSELNLGYNQLTGPLPDLSGMSGRLQLLDLSNNYFNELEIPDWLLTLNALMTLVIDNGPLYGVLPEKLFSLPQLQQVNLTNNKLSGELAMGNYISPQLQLVNLQDNEITSLTPSTSYKKTLILIDNPVCNSSSNLAKTSDCQVPGANPYSTNQLGNCVYKACSETGQKLNPKRCLCAYPYEGTLTFSASFSDLTNHTVFQTLENDMCKNLNLSSVLLENLHWNKFSELQIDLSLFPSNDEDSFTRSEVQTLGYVLSNHTYLPPFDIGFGPYTFVADPYNFQAVLEGGKSGTSQSLILGISIGIGLLLIVLVGVAVYMIWLRKRAAGTSIGLPVSFASSNGSVQLKGARWFSYDELKKCTNNFSSNNVIGCGGFGMVYRGMLLDRQLVAIKRAFQGSTQGIVEFKTEIELLSRVHHKNLVSLIGFCFEQTEQILVYEFQPNGSVKDSLLGKSGIHLDWTKRLQIALGSARGLAYLHESANPPIIHRDVKSTNILLDDNLNAKVADFGISKLVSDSSKGHVSTQVKGTMGYLDPEYYQLQQLTEKSDVYSFGVVMLELLTAKEPIEKGKNMVREVRTALDKANDDLWGLRELIDPALGSSTASLPGFAMYVELALQCAEESALDRPTMGEAVRALEMMLHNIGIGTNSTVSASSTMTDFGNVKDGQMY